MKRFLLPAAAIAVWALALTRVSGAEPSATKPFTVVAFGDSTTSARPDTEVYIEQLQRRFPTRPNAGKFLNRGVPSNTTALARQRLAKDVLSAHPDVVIVQFGINDSTVDVWKKPPPSSPRVSLADYEANLRYFIRAIRAAGAEVILMTPNQLRWTPFLVKLYGRPPYEPSDARGFTRGREAYADVLRRVAAELKAPLVDVYALDDAWEKAHGRSCAELLLDGMHPNTAGHTLIADQLLPLVERLAAK